MSRFAYVDTSALVKLVLDEEHSQHMLETYARTEFISSRITYTEAIRAVHRRLDGDELEPRMQVVLASCDLRDVDAHVLERAAGIGPAPLRTLDAIHLATVAEHVEAIDAVVTYDQRLAGAARALGFRVVSPGAA